MTGGALSKEAMLASLRDIRLPDVGAGGWVSDLAVAVGLASTAALIIALAARLVSQRRSKPSARTPREALDHALRLPEAERRIALLQILRARAPERYRALTRDLYSLEGAPDTRVLEAEAAAHV
ncbi:MAG: hypothetical protein AAGC86_03995 [Pseudomonadota bacterium]